MLGIFKFRDCVCCPHIITVFVDETRKGTISKVERGRQASETKQFRIKRLKMKMACTLSISRRENKGRHWWPRST